MAGLHVPLSTLRHSPRGPSTHDLGPSWIATPSMSGVLIPFLMPVHPGAFPTFHAEAADRARVAYMPGTAWPVIGCPPDSSWDLVRVPVPMPPQTNFDTSTAKSLRSPSRSPPDASRAPFPHRSPRRSSANAACGGLKPPPAGRLRRAFLHLPHSITSRN